MAPFPEISRAVALNYLKVSRSVIVLAEGYPVGMDKSVCTVWRKECGMGVRSLPLDRTVAASPERHRGLKEKRAVVLNHLLPGMTLCIVSEDRLDTPR